MNAHVNEACIGCGLCVNLCPGVFTMLDEGVAAAKDEIPPEENGMVQEAAESCPVNAIEVT
jgi:ferredoxin